MIASGSGHAPGIFLQNWSPLIPSAYTRKSGGMLFLMGQIIETIEDVQRLIVFSGDALASRDCMASSFDGRKVRDVYLPRWLIVDVTVLFDGAPRTMTFLSVSERSNAALPEEDPEDMFGAPRAAAEFETKHHFFVGYNRANVGLDAISAVMGKWNLEELWHRITGVVKPSWGTYVKSDGGIYVADCNMHFGVISDYSYPVGFDMTDVGRFENFLVSSGVSAELDERPVEDVARTLKILDCKSNMWLKAVERIAAESR